MEFYTAVHTHRVYVRCFPHGSEPDAHPRVGLFPFIPAAPSLLHIRPCAAPASRHDLLQDSISDGIPSRSNEDSEQREGEQAAVQLSTKPDLYSRWSTTAA